MTDQRRGDRFGLATIRLGRGTRPPPGLTDLIIAAGSDEDRVTVATHVVLTVEQFHALARCASVTVDRALAERDDLPPQLAADLASRQDLVTLAALVTNVSVPYDLRPQLTARYLTHPDVTSVLETVDRLPSRGGAGTRWAPRPGDLWRIAALLERDTALRRATSEICGPQPVALALQRQPAELTTAEVRALADSILDGRSLHTPAGDRDRPNDVLIELAQLAVSLLTARDPADPRIERLHDWAGDALPARTAPTLATMAQADLARLAAMPADPQTVRQLPFATVDTDRTDSPAWNTVVLATLYELLGDNLDAWSAASTIAHDLDPTQTVEDLLTTVALLARS